MLILAIFVRRLRVHIVYLLIKNCIRAVGPMSSELVKISVLGGGAWGTSLALHSARKGHDVLIWAREQEVVDAINIDHENIVFFKV